MYICCFSQSKSRLAFRLNTNSQCHQFVGHIHISEMRGDVFSVDVNATRVVWITATNPSKMVFLLHKVFVWMRPEMLLWVWVQITRSEQVLSRGRMKRKGTKGSKGEHSTASCSYKTPNRKCFHLRAVRIHRHAYLMRILNAEDSKQGWRCVLWYNKAKTI